MHMRGPHPRTNTPEPRMHMRGIPRAPRTYTPEPRMHMRGLPSAFTLIELMVVLSIIIIIVAIAVPVWSTLSGNNSIATAQNQIASMLGNARADALYNRQMTGVFFFLDPTTGQTAMAEVQADLVAQTNPPAAGTAYYPSYTTSSVTNGQTITMNNSNINVVPLEMVNYLINPLPTTPGANAYVYYRDVLLLPAGVGVVLSNNVDPYGLTYANNPTAYQQMNASLDRYVHCGAIMFDATGQVTTIPYAVPMVRQTPYTVANTLTMANQLGKRLGLFPPVNGAGGSGNLGSQVQSGFNDGGAQPPPTGSDLYPLVSQVGLLLYDGNAYGNQRTSANAAFTKFDLEYALPGTPTYSMPLIQDKRDEETWLDQNGVAFLVSPFNGSLIKAK